MKPYPLKFKPIFKERIWGGQKLREVFGKDIPPGERIGESWELADLPNDKSVISNGELAGQTLNAAIGRYAEQITGERWFRGPFPLLIKFLDAQDILSVQVHPDEQTCRRMAKGEPKTECWYIISAGPRSAIYKGLKKAVTKERFAEAIAKGTVPQLLERVPVAAGECHFLPAGTAHSLGGDLLVAEIQTPSDTTYRVFDWGRIDEAGRPRELHITEALESIHFGDSGGPPAVTGDGILVDCEYFTVDKGCQGKSRETPLSPGKMRMLVVISGDGTIIGRNGGVVEFRQGDTLLVPAAYEGTLRSMHETQFLTVTV